ncbi:MAG: hypothetical protein HY543_06280, partial [Deltaproteobacteria bacterium]|nr:hypothetical protein [Deltaproteobacteria bacterium]
MSLPVTAVQRGPLYIPITDEKVAGALALIDVRGNRDGIVSEADILPDLPVTDAVRREALAGLVVSAFVEAGAISGSALQQSGLRRFLVLADRIDRFDRLTSAWFQNQDPHDGQLVFPSIFWERWVKPSAGWEGEFTPAKISEMSRELYINLYRLADTAVPASPEALPTNRGPYACALYLVGLEFPMERVPAVIRPTVEKVIGQYARSMGWLLQFSEIRCKGFGCHPSDASISLDQVTFWPLPTGLEWLPSART